MLALAEAEARDLTRARAAPRPCRASDHPQRHAPAVALDASCELEFHEHDLERASPRRSALQSVHIDRSGSERREHAVALAILERRRRSGARSGAAASSAGADAAYAGWAHPRTRSAAPMREARRPARWRAWRRS